MSNHPLHTRLHLNLNTDVQFSFSKPLFVDANCRMKETHIKNIKETKEGAEKGSMTSSFPA